MLLIILTTIFLFIIFLGFSSLINNSYNNNSFISIHLIKGMFIVGLLSAYFAIWIPLNLYFELSILVIGIILFVFNKQAIYLKRISTFPKSFFCFGIILLFVSSMNAYIFDTFSYYLPTIKWLDDYGFIKGLANFDFNLGQNSLWHITQATFNETIDQFYKINLFVTIIFLLYIYETKQEKYLLFLPIFFLFIASTSPDLPVFILSIIIFLNYLNHKNDESIKFGLIVSCFIVLIKPIAFVLPIFFLFLWIKECKTKNIKEIFIVFLLIGIFIIKNIILTANVTFPLAFGNLEFLEYSIPEEIYKLSSIDGKYLATSRTKLVDYEDFKNWTTLQYYIYILNNLNTSIIIYLIISFIHLIFLIYSITKQNINLIILASLLFLKVIVFFMISIQYRFILDGFLIIVCVFIYNLKLKPVLFIIPFTIIALLFVFIANIFKYQNMPFFMQGITKYEWKQLFISNNYISKGVKTNFTNYKANVAYSYPASLDMKQPTLNYRLLNQYYFQGFHSTQIDSLNINKGFKLIKNDSTSSKEIIKNIQLIKEKSKNR